MSSPAPEVLAELARDYYPGVEAAEELLRVAADIARPADEREAASARLVQLDRERILRDRARTGGPGAARDPDTWEESAAKAGDIAAPDARKLKPRTLAELASAVDAVVTWVVDRIVPADGALVLFAGFMKTGKSTLLYALIGAVLRGLPFLGFETRQGPVLLLAVEELERDVLIRLRGFGVRDEAALRVHVGMLPDSPGMWRELRAYIRELRPALVILDTWTRFSSVRDENDNAQVAHEAGKWLDLARETATTVLLVVHEGKAGGEHGRSIRGASALFGLADQAVILDRRRGGAATQRVLKILGRYHESPAELVIDLEGGTYTVLGTPEQADMDAGAATLANALTSEPRTFQQLADETKLAERMVRKLIRRIDGVVIEGKGKRGDPLTARLA